MFNNDIFSVKKTLIEKIQESEVIFVADLYSDEYLGGAEITTDVFFDGATRKVCKIKCSDLSNEVLEAGLLKHWVFFNYASMNYNNIPGLVANLEYSIKDKQISKSLKYYLKKNV